MKIFVRQFLHYKLLNSLFTGAVTGSVFTVYSLLEPSLFSIGGVAVAVGTFFVATLYAKLLSIRNFFLISLTTEILTLITIAIFLILQKSYLLSALYFWIYQAIFIFGIYLIRAESLFLGRIKLISMIDSIKQKGYLGGLLISFLTYKGCEWAGIKEAWEQVSVLYIALILLQTVVILKLWRSFSLINTAK